MNFLWVTITVNNLDESIKFYEDIIGLKLSSRRRSGGDKEIAFLEDGKSITLVELYCYDEGSPVLVGQDYSIGFETDSVEECIKLANEKNLKILSDILQPSPKVKFFFIADPDGRKVQLLERIKQ